MSLTIKAFLHEQTWRGEPKEIRRFTIDQDVTTSFAYLLEKLAQVFPSVQAGNVVVAWMDNEGDLIVISSDEELVQALDQFDGTVFRLYLKKRSSAPFFGGPPFSPRPATVEGEAGERDQTQQQPPPAEGEEASQQTEQQGEGGQQPQQPGGEGVLHPGVVCDGCHGPIHGTRYKCLVCSDYDLCSGCEAKGQHVDHNMVTITDPFSYNPWGFQHPWAHGFGGGHPCRGPWWGQQRGRHGFGFHGPHGGFQHPCPPSGPCPPGGPWAGFGGGHPRCFRGGYRGRGRCPGGGGRATWWRYAAEREAGKASGESEPMETGADSKQPDQQQQSQPSQAGSEEERRSFLHGIGQAVSSFLEPFGVKVDVDVVGGEGEAQPSAPPTSEGTPPTSSAAEPQPSEEVPAEFIEQSLAQLRSMGYEDEGGWLTELVKAKGGDIAKVLDALHPSTDPTVAETD